MLDESLFRLKIDDKLNVYNNYYEYKVNGNCCQYETLNLVVIRIYGILQINYKMWVLVDISIVIRTDIKGAIGYRDVVVGKN